MIRLNLDHKLDAAANRYATSQLAEEFLNENKEFMDDNPSAAATFAQPSYERPPHRMVPS